MTILKLCLLLLTFPIFLMAQEVQCPPEATLLDYVSTVTNGRVQVCQKQVEGKYLKHGPEVFYNADGTVKSKKYYQLGEEVPEPLVVEKVVKCPPEAELVKNHCVPISGVVWKGRYSCPNFQGETQLTLTMGTDNFRAVFDFVAKKARGKFFMKGKFDPETKELTFEPLEWIEKPPTYFMVSMKGLVDFEEHTYKGSMTGCATFDLKALNVAPL